MILFTTQNFLPDIGGQQAYVTGLADALAARGHTVEVLADTTEPRAAKAVDSARRYRIVRFGGMKPLRRLRKGRMAARLIRGGGVRAVVADSWKSLEHLPPRGCGARVICLCHGSELLVPHEGARGERVRRALAKADVAAANSRYTGDLARVFAGPETETVVLLPGVEPPGGAPRSLDRSAGNRDTHPRLLTIARLEPRKGIDTVLRALPTLTARFPGLTYEIAGAGDDGARLAALADELGVAQAVRFHGRVDEAAKARLLSEADLFVLPNRIEPESVEGFGLVFLEAAAFGVPSLAGAEGGAGDAVADGVTGRVVAGSDVAAVAAALGELLSDRAALRRMGEAAHARFWSEFAWDAAVARFEAVLFADRVTA